MQGVKFYLLHNNFSKEFSFEKIKKYIEEECESYLSFCQCETKTVRAIPWKPFIYNIKQCLNLESYDLKLTVEEEAAECIAQHPVVAFDHSVALRMVRSGPILVYSPEAAEVAHQLRLKL